MVSSSPFLKLRFKCSSDSLVISGVIEIMKFMWTVCDCSRGVQVLTDVLWDFFYLRFLRNCPRFPPNNPKLLNESKLCRSGALGTRGKCLTWQCCYQRAGVHCLAGNETRIFFICSRHQMVFQAFDIFWGIKELSVIRHSHVNMKWNTVNSVLQIPWYQQQEYQLLLV